MTRQERQQLEEMLSKEEKINLIRYGPKAINLEKKKVEVNLLKKYKPLFSVNDYKKVIENLDINMETLD